MNYIIRFAVVLLTLFLLSCKNTNNTAVSQPKNDSIKKYLELASNDTLPIPDRNEYNKKAFSFIDLSKNDTLTRWYLNNISYNSFTTRSWKNYLSYSKMFYKLSIEKKDTLNLARYFRYKSIYFNENYRADSAYFYCIKSEKYYKKTKDLLGLGIVVLNKGILKNDVNDYLSSQLNIAKSIVIFNKINNKKYSAVSKSCLADTYTETGESELAIKLYLSILEEIKSEKFKCNMKVKANVLNNLGDTYGRRGLLNKEKDCYDLALEDKNLVHSNPSIYYLLKVNLARNKIDQKNFNDVENILLSIINKENEIKNTNISFRARLILSKFYQKTNRITESEKYAEEALKIARNSNITYDILNSLVQVAATNKEKAPKCIIEYDKKIDSLLSAERKTRSQFYKIQLDVDQITQEKETAISQKWVITSMMTGILLIVILLFVIFYQKAKQKEVELQQAQQKANEETYQMLLNQQALQDEAKTVEKKRIALELHDNILNKLASIRFNLYPITQINDPEIQKNAEKHVNKIKDVEDEIRTISHDFSNDLFAESYSFKIILEKLIDEQNKLYPDTHYRLELEDKINLDNISSKIKMNMYRIIQEVLYNVHKHAKATRVAVAIIQDESNICISILDDGIGFDTSKTKEGIGIMNIKLRIKQLSGKFSVISSSKYGTAINMAIPIVTINK